MFTSDLSSGQGEGKPIYLKNKLMLNSTVLLSLPPDHKMSLFNQCLEVFTLQIQMVNVWYGHNCQKSRRGILCSSPCINSFCSNYLESQISFVVTDESDTGSLMAEGVSPLSDQTLFCSSILSFNNSLDKKWTSASRSESGKIVLVTTKNCSLQEAPQTDP